MSRPRRPLLAALVLPLVVIVGFQSAWAAYACRVDGKVRDTCCCKAKPKKHQPVPDAPSLASRGCCEVTLHETPRAPVGREPEQANPVYLPLVAPVISVASIAPPVLQPPAIALVARPPPRVPRFLDHQSILR